MSRICYALPMFDCKQRADTCCCTHNCKRWRTRPCPPPPPPPPPKPKRKFSKTQCKYVQAIEYESRSHELFDRDSYIAYVVRWPRSACRPDFAATASSSRTAWQSEQPGLDLELSS